MKTSSQFGALCAIAIVSTSAHAANLMFEFSGETDASFGPVVRLSGSFLFDTNASTVIYPGTLNGISYIGQFDVTGGVSDFHAQLDEIWSLDSPVTSDIGAYLDCPPCDPSNPDMWLWDVFMSVDGNVDGSMIGIDFKYGKQNRQGTITTQEWMESLDPVAEFFLYDTTISFSAFIDVPNDPNYPQGWAGADVNVVVTAVPIPPAFYLFGSSLIGLVGIAKYKRPA